MGTATNPIVVMGTGTPQFPGDSAFFTNGSRGVLMYGGNFVYFENLHFRNGKSIYGPSYGGRVSGCSFVGSGFKFGAISSNLSSNIIIENNFIHVANSSTQDHGIYVSAGAKNVTIRNNWVQAYMAGGGAQGYGIHDFDQHRNDPNDPRTGSNHLIEGNTVIGFTNRGGIIVQANDDVTITNYTIRNNIVKNCDTGIRIHWGGTNNGEVYSNTIDGAFWGIHLKGINDSIKIINNIFLDNIDRVIWNEQPAAGNKIIAQTNIYFPDKVNIGVNDPNSPTADPLLSDPNGFDWSLTATSPAIDAGTDVGIAYQGNGPDLGAVESPYTGPVVLKPGASLADGQITFSAYPNPASGRTGLTYQIPKDTYLKLSVFNTLGQQVALLIDRQVVAGRHKTIWYSSDLHPGVYFFQLHVNNSDKLVRKMLILN